MDQKDTQYLFDQPGLYRIFVQGQLSREWPVWLGDMEITVEESANQQSVTILTGEVRDQAALMGVLNTLYDMRCSVLKVEQFDPTLSANDSQTDEA